MFSICRLFKRFSPFVKFSNLPDCFVFARNNHLCQRKISVLKPCGLHFPTELFGDFDLMLPEHMKLMLFEFQTLTVVKTKIAFQNIFDVSESGNTK